MDTPVAKKGGIGAEVPPSAASTALVVIQGGSTPETLPEAITEIAQLRIKLAQMEELGMDVKAMGHLMAHLLGEMGILEIWEKAKSQKKMGVGTKMKIAKRLTSGVMDMLSEDSELRKIFDDTEKMESFKRVLAYASAK